jgi:endoglucanase
LQQDIPALRLVRPVTGRRSHFAKSKLGFATLALVAGIAACSGDSATGPVTEPGVTAKSAPSNPKSDTTTKTSPTPTPTTAAGTVFWVDPSNSASVQANAWRASRPSDAAQMDKLASKALAKWFGDWNADIYSAVNAVVTSAANAARVPVLVAYNIPSRDCGGLSGGGGATASAYRTWIGSFASALAGRKAIVVVEPDALGGMDCLSSADQQTRVDLLAYAVQVLKAQPNVSVYLDAGNPTWHSPSDMASRLSRASVGMADGFSLNVSNFYNTSDNVSYGQSISSLTGGKHFIVDTSRNGLGPTADHQWCNPDGRGLGAAPTTSTGNSLVDAFLWIKVPGESDGACNGGPNAGQWWGDYALGLVNRSTL